MTKYYCDICNREVKSIEEYTLPSLGDKEWKDRQGNVIRRGYVFMPTKMELCRECVSTVGHFLHILSCAPAETHINKSIKKIEWEE